MRTVIFILTILGLLLVGGWTIAKSQAGIKPTKPMIQKHFSWKAEFEEFLNPLEATYKEKPNDLAASQAYAKALETILAVKFIPEIAHELIIVNKNTIRLSGTEVGIDLLNKQADLYFAVKEFNLAEQAYRLLLKGNEDNYDLRGRLASSLSFQGKYDEAIKELEFILKKQPDAFQALAYLGITYAQMGKNDQALKYANQALKLAPSAEARQRLGSFLSKLEAELNQVSPKSGDDRLNGLYDYFKNSEVTADRFKKAVLNNGTLKIYLVNFPMQEMPDFAKQKFLDNVKATIISLEVKEIKFIDLAGNKVMLTLPIDR